MSSPLARYRWSVASRTLAATVGAYAVTSLLVLALTLLAGELGMNRARTLHTVTLGSFWLYALLVLVAFHMRSASRVWMLLLLLAAPAGIVTLVLS